MSKIAYWWVLHPRKERQKKRKAEMLPKVELQKTDVTEKHNEQKGINYKTALLIN